MIKLIGLTGILGAGAVFGGVEAGMLPCPLELTRSVLGSTERAVGASTGDYYEARTCTVWGGACHVNGESESQGRRALLAWSFDAGPWGGARAVAAVESDANLARGAERRAAFWVDAPARWTDGQRDELVAALAADAELRVVASEPAEVSIERTGDEFTVSVPGVVALAGAALADRSCCSMPESRWYDPLATSEGSVVGNPWTCSFEGAHGLARWRYEDENTAFVARVRIGAQPRP